MSWVMSKTGFVTWPNTEAIFDGNRWVAIGILRMLYINEYHHH